MSDAEVQKLRQQVELAAYTVTHRPETFQAFAKFLHDQKLTKHLPKLQPSGRQAWEKAQLLSLLGKAHAMPTHEVGTALQGLGHDVGWLRQTLPGEIVAAATTASTKSPEQTSPSVRAIAMIVEAQGQRKKVLQKDIAKAVGANRIIFHRDPTLKGAWRAYKDSFRLNVPFGYVNDDGTLEAEE